MPKDKPIIKEKPHSKKTQRELGLTWFVLIILAFLIGVPAYIFLPKHKTYKLANYTYATVGEATFRELIRGTGSLKPQIGLEITNKYKGIVKSVSVESLSDVTKGDLLLKIDSPELNNSRKEQEELLVKAQTELEKVLIDRELELQKLNWSIREQQKVVNDNQDTLEEKELMYKLGTVSQKSLEEAKLNVLNSQEELAMREKNLAKVEITTSLAVDTANKQIKTITEKIHEIEKSIRENTYTAPITGKVLEVFVKPSSEINAGTTLLKIVSVDDPYVEIKIASQDAERIEEGLPALLKIAGRSHHGEVAKLSYATSLEQGIPYLLAEIVFINNPGFILPHTEVQVEIETSKRDQVVCLPRGPFLSSGQSMFVYKIEGAKAYRTDIKYGGYDGNLIEIKTGLNPGDKIITSSYEAFKDEKEIILNPEGGRADD